MAAKTLPQALTTPPAYKKVNPADVPVSDALGAFRHRAADHGRRICQRFHGAADFAGVGRRPGLGVRRPHAVDPRPGRSRQACRKRHHARRHPRHAGQFDHQRRQRRDQYRQDHLHHRRQRPDHRRRQIQRRRAGLSQRRADPGARRRPGGRRSGRPHRRRLSEQPRRRHPRGVQAARRQRHRHRRPDQGAAAAAHRAHSAGGQGRNHSRPHDHDPRLGDRRRVHLGAHHLPRGDGDPAVPAQFLGDAHSERDRAFGARRLVRGDVPDAFQPRQPVADGADHRGRLRGRRRHRGGGEYLPPRRARRAAVHRGAARLARDRLHGAVDLLLADRGVHSAAC